MVDKPQLQAQRRIESSTNSIELGANDTVNYLNVTVDQDTSLLINCILSTNYFGATYNIVNEVIEGPELTVWEDMHGNYTLIKVTKDRTRIGIVRFKNDYYHLIEGYIIFGVGNTPDKFQINLIK